MASIQVLPATGGQNQHAYSRLPVPLKFKATTEETFPPDSTPLKVPTFIQNSNHYVLVRSLASLWNLPSSYQVISKLYKGSQVPKKKFLNLSTKELNEALVEHGLIPHEDINRRQFFVSVSFVYLILEDKLVLVGQDALINSEKRKRPVIAPQDDDTITVSQVFPQYGRVDSTTPLDHAAFLALTPLTKLLVYKHEGNYRRVYGTSLSSTERELIVTANNYTAYPRIKEAVQDLVEPITQTSSLKKPLGRSKKQAGVADPNTLDVAENILPGNGQIPDFLVSPICKVPNYFVTNGQMSSAQQNILFNSQFPHLQDLKLKFPENPQMSRQVQQFLLNNEQDNFSSKYFYYKSYRGPGSGNYKDAALVNRINKIRTFTAELAPKDNSTTHLPSNRVRKPGRRLNRPVKGLTHDFYSPENVEVSVDKQRKFTEDFVNLEMLHNTVLFNLLVNCYREVAGDMWNRYYKFKQVDFEKLYLIDRANERMRERDALLLKEKEQYELIEGPKEPFRPSLRLVELLRPDPTNRFTPPLDHPEIMSKLPLELRGIEGRPETALSRPIRYTAAYPDRQFMEVLNQIEVIKLPNANSLGWDNIKKYREDN